MTKTALQIFKEEFVWVRKRLLEEFEDEYIKVGYYDGGNCLAVGVEFYKNGELKRSSIKLIDTKGVRFDQTQKNEEYLEKFIENLKA